MQYEFAFGKRFTDIYIIDALRCDANAATFVFTFDTPE